ncbi:ketopantoate reductase [Aquimarina sp. MAR_2010_214]|uniref:ketopantoate reductase family protein n=1 Tax=Aquimarina sp. MAR_2010_214 TaxID=1250026 RepID=UPI000C7087C1|nr:2-dehydropantoate 2-reductase [Aquimarina sp. MAR_2010_214]PKV48381.1 ketopantoate reductase [Aquimarina sp. MAR_2010_214]
MHTVIIGVGGVGGYFGGKISDSGQKVTLVARGEHLEVIKKNGLQVKSINGDFVTHPFHATDQIGTTEKADIVLICTKSWQVAEAAKLIKPILKEDTVIIPLQNGADNAEKVCSVVETKYVLGGLCKIYSKIEAPGIISHFGHQPEVVFGELDKSETERLQKVKKVFDKAGFNNAISKDIEVDIWSKFMFITAVSGIGALTRATIGEVYENPETHRILEQTATEIYNIGIAKGVSLPEDIVSRILAFIGKQPYDSTASMQRDIMEGRPSELDNFNGFIVKEGAKLGVLTPVNTFIYSCLQPMETKARK